MATFLSTFTTISLQVVLPITLVIALGFVAHKYLNVEAHAISKLTFYVMGPALAFSSLSRHSLSGTEAASIAAAVLLLALLLWAIADPTSKLLHMDQKATASFVMGILFMNTGNYGLPVAFLAFGQPGLERAVVAFVAQAVLINTLGIFIASRSNHRGTQGLVAVFRVPMIYAALAGVTISLFHLQVPAPVAAAADMVGQGAIPTLLLILGIQLGQTVAIKGTTYLALACLLRMLVSPVIGYLLSYAMGLPPLSRAVVTLAAGMPSAVNTIVMAIEFKTDVRLSTAIVVATTAVSLVSIAAILSFLSLLTPTS